METHKGLLIWDAWRHIKEARILLDRAAETLRCDYANGGSDSYWLKADDCSRASDSLAGIADVVYGLTKVG